MATKTTTTGTVRGTGFNPPPKPQMTEEAAAEYRRKATAAAKKTYTYPGVTADDVRRQVAELAADYSRLIVSGAGGFPVVGGDRELFVRTCVSQARAFYDELYRPTTKPGQGRRVGKKRRTPATVSSDGTNWEDDESEDAQELGVGGDYAEFFDEGGDSDEGSGK